MPVSYTMKMHELLWKAGLDNTGPNRRLLDKAVRETLGLEKNEEDDVWGEVQRQMHDPDAKKEFEGRIIKLLLTY